MKYSPMFGNFIGPARAWFAWRPVRLFDGSLVWLRTIERRRVQKHTYLDGPMSQWWFYSRHGDLA